MTPLNLDTLLSGCSFQQIQGATDRMISGICYNSQKTEKDFLFIAIKGVHTDGHKYIEDAIRRGACAIIYQDPPALFSKDITYVKVEDSKSALSAVAAAFYQYPASNLKTIGITGTDGKSTTVWFIQQLLTCCEKKSGFISTVQFQTGDEPQKNPYRQSTPEALEINSILAEMVKQGKEYAVIETTSHGLSLANARLADISFNAAVFTNITHEHLEFHGTFEQYRYDKANLFRQLNKGGAFGIINRDDPSFSYFMKEAEAPVFTYSLKDQDATLFAEITNQDFSGTEIKLFYNNKTSNTRLNIPGAFNIENLLASLLVVSKLTGINLHELAQKAPLISGVTGRVKTIEKGQPFTVIVDYAHTPESFNKIFSLVKPLTRKRLIAVFGSAGERDTIKRPIQGEIASRFSDILILTDEDPRGEDRMKILKEIAAGCNGFMENQNLFLIPSRKEAIARAFELAEEGDTVLTLGKGHESSIIYQEGPISWDEITVCEELLNSYL